MSHAFMTFYVGDYLRDTGHLSTEEHGAYLLLLLHAWTKNGVLPPDDELLRRITRLAPKAWIKARTEVMKFFHLQDDGYHQKRMDKELDKARAMVAKRQEAVQRTQHWRAANHPPKPNGQHPSDDRHVMHNERITDAQREHTVTPPLSVPQPQPQPYPEPERDLSLSSLYSRARSGNEIPWRSPAFQMVYEEGLARKAAEMAEDDRKRAAKGEPLSEILARLGHATH